MLFCHKIHYIWVINTLLLQNLVVDIYALFPPIFLGWQIVSAIFFCFLDVWCFHICISIFVFSYVFIFKSQPFVSNTCSTQHLVDKLLERGNLFALIQAICGHFQKVLRGVWIYISSSFDVTFPPRLYWPIFQFHPRNFATKTKWNGGWQ